jgi:membrane associated rhomboid family serine protease
MRTPPRLTEYARYPVVAGVAVLSIAVTVARWSGVDVASLLDSAMIRRGELWRLLTSILPHGDILHLAFNVYWLWVFGSLVEEVLGHLKTAALIVLFAVGSSAMEFAFLRGGIGLSGVGYGLFGLLWMLSERDPRFHDAVDKSTIQLFVVWFFFCIVTTWFNIMAVANIAHGAGAVLGILTGLALSLRRNRALAATGAATFFLLSLVAATVGRPFVNVDKQGYEEFKWGYDALLDSRNDEAVRWLRDAVRYEPGESVFWYDLGLAELQSGRRAEAYAAFQRAHNLEPNDPVYSEAMNNAR